MYMCKCVCVTSSCARSFIFLVFTLLTSFCFGFDLILIGKCILSERSTFDPTLDAEYEDAIIFSDNLNDLINKIFDLSEQPERIELCQQQAEKKFRLLDSNIDGLQQAMTEIISRF